jgi:hypothetical protein
LEYGFGPQVVFSVHVWIFVRRDTRIAINKEATMAAELDVTRFHQRLAKLHKHFVKHK